MKTIVKFQMALSFATLSILSGCYFPFNNQDEEYNFDPVIYTEPGKITAENCWDFGKIIDTDGDHVLVSSYDDIHIFKFNSSGMELIQTIEFEETSGIFSMIVYRSELIFGLAEADGTGAVYVYTRKGDVWELSQKIRKGIKSDNFGCAIDIDDETMVIGANSIWSGCVGNNCMGKVYVFQKIEGVWEETQEILAEQAEYGDWFGTCVGIHGDLMLAGSPMLPLHVFRFSGAWELSGTEEISALAIAHNENNFMLSGEYEIRAFILEEDGSFSANTMDSIDKQDLPYYGGIVAMRDSLALVATEPEKCYLLKYGDREWNIENIFSPDPGEYCWFSGMAITDHYAIIGGMNSDDSQFGYVYFRDL